MPSAFAAFVSHVGGFGTSCASCVGKNRIADAKMIGTTFAPLILSGM